MESLIIVIFIFVFGAYEVYMIRKDAIGIEVAKDLRWYVKCSLAANAYDLTCLLNGVSLRKLSYLARRLNKNDRQANLYNMFRLANEIKTSKKKSWLFRPTLFRL